MHLRTLKWTRYKRWTLISATEKRNHLKAKRRLQLILYLMSSRTEGRELGLWGEVI